jgi:magnesium-protoporphyrin IX monomethyl ester (oxidative) cyclase
MGLESTGYDYTVFRITNEITRQVFPVMLDIDSPAFRAGLARLFHIQTQMDAAKARGGVLGTLRRGFWALAGVATFARLYTLPVLHNTLPADVRVAPAW